MAGGSGRCPETVAVEALRRRGGRPPSRGSEAATGKEWGRIRPITDACAYGEFAPKAVIGSTGTELAAQY